MRNFKLNIVRDSVSRFKRISTVIVFNHDNTSISISFSKKLAIFHLTKVGLKYSSHLKAKFQ